MNKTIGNYTIETNKLNEFFSLKKDSIVYIQLPEGLQQYAMELKKWLEASYQLKIILDADPTYGACDLPSESIMCQLNVSAVIQFGHFPIPSMESIYQSIPILFVNVQSNLPIDGVVKKSISNLCGPRIGLVTTAQHIHQLENIKTLLEEHGFIVIIGKGDSRIFSAGQILGCNFSAATSISEKIDSFLFVGTGYFHAIGLLLSTNKPIIVADPYTNQIIDRSTLLDRKHQLLRQRYGAIAFGKQARTIGVIIGLKPGQMRIQYAFEIQQKINESGKTSMILALDSINHSIVDRFPFIDVFISTACPRIAIDDYTSYKKPILTPVELEIALNEKEWDMYVFDEIIE